MVLNKHIFYFELSSPLRKLLLLMSPLLPCFSFTSLPISPLSSASQLDTIKSKKPFVLSGRDFVIFVGDGESREGQWAQDALGVKTMEEMRGCRRRDRAPRSE